MTETIGQQLKQAREARNLTIEKVVQATRIRARHLEAIEADDFESLPSPVQARAFLRIYAEFLGLSLDELISRQREGIGETADESQAESETPDNLEPAESKPGPLGKSIGNSLQITLDKLKDALVRIAQPITSRIKKPAVPNEPAGENAFAEPDDSSSLAADDHADVDESIDESSSESRPSQAIFADIGETLRQRRESLSLTLDEIERHTHVRKHYLEALEAGEFDGLPSSVQTRGMLNNYAHFLDIDVDAILLKFAEGLQAQRLERQPKPVEKTQKQSLKFPIKINLPPGLRRYLSMDTLVGGGLILILLIFAIWGTSRIIGLGSASAPLPTAPSISDILQTPPGAAATALLPANASGAGTNVPTLETTIAVTNPAPIQGAVQITVVALESAWVRVTVDGKVEFEGRVTSGMVYPYGGNTQIEVLTGNGSAIRILYNQSDLGQMGTFGQVVDRIYTVNAILVPTSTSTPTVTVTPIPSATTRPTATLRPSSTPRRSPTPTP